MHEVLGLIASTAVVGKGEKRQNLPCQVFLPLFDLLSLLLFWGKSGLAHGEIHEVKKKIRLTANSQRGSM
jgi:hypothetical protein